MTNSRVQNWRGGIVCAVLLACLLAGCGYPGDPLPPALNRPVQVTDLAAVERGSKIILHFTVPRITTEGLPVKGTPEIDLRIGPMPAPAFTFPAWESGAERVQPSAIQVTAGSAQAEIDASRFSGKNEVISVRVKSPNGLDAGWSAPQILAIVPPLPTPEGLTAADAPDAVRLDWHAAAPEFRVFRKQPQDPEWRLIGTSQKPSWLDSGIEYGKTYQYMTQSVEKAGDRYAESDLSDPVTFQPTDRFAPAAPAGVTAVPGTKSIELVWDRSPEKDLAFYRVYRDGQRIADHVTAPALSDKDVQSGTTHRYQVSAVDSAGNESPMSAPVEANLP